MTLNEPNPGFKVMVLCKGKYFKSVHFVQLKINYLINVQCNVPLTPSSSTIAEPLVHTVEEENAAS